jgi:choline dehydrogenase-like flavoprotein
MKRSSGRRVIVIGSGAGGAVTAHELAARGYQVLVLEEGARFGLEDYGRSFPQAARQLYRHRGMTPIVGRVPLGFVEGCCVGGSTEINSGFWRRTPAPVLEHWKAEFGLADAAREDLEPHFEWAERALNVGHWPEAETRGTQLMMDGARNLGWAAEGVPRAAPGCANTNTCAQGCPTGAKQGMSRNLIPRAEALGARVIAGCTAMLVILDGARASAVLADLANGDGSHEVVRIEADHVFVCAGATQTPALLRRSGVRRNVGDSFLIHPMLKVAAAFGDPLDSHRSVLPLAQVSEFAPEITLGGAYFSLAQYALLLGDNWRDSAALLSEHRHAALYHVTAKGSGRGRVRPSVLDEGAAALAYELSDDDLRHLSQGLARLSALLLAAGASAVHPGVSGLPLIRSRQEADRWLTELLPRKSLSLTSVHAFSSCPAGERRERCAADSWGRVHGLDNLYVNDASMLPDSPGVNPQASIMALARRNVVHFTENRQ